MNKSVLSMLAICPHCGTAFLPGQEGRPDGSACYECEGPIYPEEPRVRDGEDIV